MSPVFKAIQEVLVGYAGNAIKKKLIKLAVGQITSRLVAFLPILGAGPIGWIVGKYVTKAVIFIMDKTIIGAHVLYIYGDVHLDKKAVRDVIKKIRESTQEGISDEDRKKLDDELAKKLIDLMEFGTM